MADIDARCEGSLTGTILGYGAESRHDTFASYRIVQSKYPNPSIKQVVGNAEFFDEFAQLKIVMDILKKEGKITPEIYAEYLRDLNKKENIVDNENYGPSTRATVKKLLEGQNPRLTGKGGVTNGAAMRASPIGVYFYENIDKVISATVEHNIISHNSDVAVAGALAVSLMTAFLIQGKDKDSALKLTLGKLKELRGKFGVDTPFAEMDERISYAVELARNADFDKAKLEMPQKIGTYWNAIESVPAAFYLYFCLEDPKEILKLSYLCAGAAGVHAGISLGFLGAEKGPEIFSEWIIEKIEKRNSISVEGIIEEFLKSRRK